MSHNCPSIPVPLLPWIILFFAMLNIIFIDGSAKGFGSFIADFHKRYSNVSLTELNWIGSTNAGLANILMPFCTFIILHFDRSYKLSQIIGAVIVLSSLLASAAIPNIKWLFLTYTVINSVGHSIIISVAGLVVNESFSLNHPYRIFATTLSMGATVSSIVCASMYAGIIQSFGWRRAYVLIGIMYFIIHLTAVIFFKRKSDVVKVSFSDLFKCDLSVYFTTRHLPLIVLWFIERCLTGIVNVGLFFNLTDYVYRTQKTLLRSTVLINLLAIGEVIAYIIASIFTGLTKDLLKDRLRYVLVITTFIMSFSLVMMEFFTSYHGLVQFLCFIVGFCIGPTFTFIYPAGEEITKLPGHVAYPLSRTGIGVGILISPLLTALIAERYNYHWFFFAQGVLVGIKVLLLFVIIILLRLQWDDMGHNNYVLVPNEVICDK